MKEKNCKICGNKLTGRQKFYCCNECKIVGRRKQFPEKYCEYCGKILVRKRHKSGLLEDVTPFSERKFCDKICYGKSITLDNPSDSTITRRLRKQRKKTACIVCGATGNLHNHHIDKNHRNNSNENVITLCAACHAGVHWILRKPYLLCSI